MLSEIFAKLSQSKNIIMLITSGIYILSLFAVQSEHVILFSAFITLLFLLIIIKNLLPLKYIFIWILIFYFGILNTSLRIKDVDELLNLAPLNSKITGTVISIPQGKLEGKTRFFFKVDKISFGSIEKTFKSEKALVTVNETPENLIKINELGLYKYVQMEGRLSAPFKAGNPSQFDYGNYLRNFDAYAVFYANDFNIVEKELSFKQKFMQGVNSYREKILSIHSKYLNSPNLEIIGGIIFGDDAVSPPQNIKQSFVNSGLLHILAASGMNVAFIYGFFFLLMSLFRIPYKLKVFLGMFMVCIYSLMTGLGASVIRATIMLLFVLIGKLIDRDAHSVALLSFVALLMLIYNPMWINDVGFQLSFIVTLGILVMAPAFGRFKNKILDFTVSTVAIPVIAQLWVIPIQIFYFNNISIYSVFANIMSVPILMILSFGGFVSSLLAGIAPISDFVCHNFDFILNPLVTLLVNISDFWGKLPNATYQTTHPNIFQIFLYYGMLSCIACLLYKELREKYLKPSLISFGTLFFILILTLIPIQNSNLEITAFDVGNADSFLIKTPDSKYLMIDTGKAGYNGGKTQAEIIMLKYMKDRGIKELDSLIISHFDSDHCGGAKDIINNIKVKKVYVNDISHDSTAAKTIYNAANNKSTEVILVQNKQLVYNSDNLKIINLSNYTGKSDNDNSIITLLIYNDFSVLFTGDAGINGIEAVIESIPRNITVLKAPHHGAVGGINKNLVKYLNPKYTLVSTGENRYGHPSLYTLELLKNSKILRTDVNNSVKFVVNQKGARVFEYNIKHRKYLPMNSF